MRRTLRILAFAALFAATGCSRPTTGVAGGKDGAPNRGIQYDSHQVFAQSLFGSPRVALTPNLCAGRATLQRGSATVNDSCFTGDTNVVLCTDVSAANPVMCAPSKDLLSIAGTGTDAISYARVK